MPTTKKTSKSVSFGPRPKAKSKSRSKPRAAARPSASRDEEALKDRLVGIALELAAEAGWAGVNSADVARRARIPREDVARLLPDRADILRHLGSMIDREMQKGGQPDGSLRDRLFEVMMRRFDALQPHRAGVVAIAGSCLADDPLLPLALLESFYTAMAATLETAGVSPSPLRQMGLAALALAVFRTWRDDESADMAATMAMLDRRLGQLEEIAQALAPLMGKK